MANVLYFHQETFLFKICDILTNISNFYDHLVKNIIKHEHCKYWEIKLFRNLEISILDNYEFRLIFTKISCSISKILIYLRIYIRKLQFFIKISTNFSILWSILTKNLKIEIYQDLPGRKASSYPIPSFSPNNPAEKYQTLKKNR